MASLPIRTARVDEFDALQRLLERSFGHGRDFFTILQPDLFRRDEDALACNWVIEESGQLVSHVGIFPMRVHAGGAQFQCGGIGAVCTDPQRRGAGHMSRLMQASVRHMREQGCSLSVLWGSRQRYGHFGYEGAGKRLALQLSRRSMAGIQPAELEEVRPTDVAVVQKVQSLYQTLPHRVDRPRFDLRLRRPGLRVFIGPDGYVITAQLKAGDFRVDEVVSPVGNEPGLILAALHMTHGDRADVPIHPHEGARTERLWALASGWSVQAQGLFRIVNWVKFAQDAAPLLGQQAVGMPPFAAAIGCKEAETTEWVTFEWDGDRLWVEPGRRAPLEREFEVRDLTARTLGHAADARIEPLRHLFPVPVHIPYLDHV